MAREVALEEREVTSVWPAAFEVTPVGRLHRGVAQPPVLHTGWLNVEVQGVIVIINNKECEMNSYFVSF